MQITTTIALYFLESLHMDHRLASINQPFLGLILLALFGIHVPMVPYRICF